MMISELCQFGQTKHPRRELHICLQKRLKRQQNDAKLLHGDTKY